MAKPVEILLVGGGVASVRCARTLRREGFAGSIAIVGDEAHAPYNRPPLSKELLRDDVPEELVMAEPIDWYERRDVALRLASGIVTIDPDRGLATRADGETIQFRRALLATGAEPVLPPVAGIHLAIPLRTLDDARRLRSAAQAAGPGARVAIVGGGFIGVEVASSLASLGLRPTVIEQRGALWGGTLGVTLSEWGVARLATAGIEVLLESPVTGVDPSGVRVGDRRVEAPLVVVGTGVRPRVDLAAAAGLALDDGIVTDAGGRTSHPAVWAAGDVARVDGQRVEHWHAAREAGERVARSMLGAEVAPVPVPWVFTEVAGVALDVIGAPDPAAEERRFGDAVLAWLRAGRAVGMAVIGGAMTATTARRLVAAGADAATVEAAAREPAA